MIELAEAAGHKESKIRFNSFDNRDEVLDCITSIWQAQSSYAQIATDFDDEENVEDVDEKEESAKHSESNSGDTDVKVIENNSRDPLPTFAPGEMLSSD